MTSPLNEKPRDFCHNALAPGPGNPGKGLILSKSEGGEGSDYVENNEENHMISR
jgi:hypothetical protein